LGQALEHIGLRIAFSWLATVVAATVVAFPLMYRACLGAFDQVNPNLFGAARTLGASEWRAFRRVLFPLVRPGVLAGLVLTFARALGEFGATLMLAGNIPGKTQTTDGEHLGLLGASGSGKSITPQCIAGLTRPEAGRVLGTAVCCSTLIEAST